MESLDLGRRLKRNCDNLVSKKRLVFVVISGLVTFYYLLPFLVKWTGFRKESIEIDVIDSCLRDRLASFYLENDEFNVNIVYKLSSTDDPPFTPYIGNGYFGLDPINGNQIFIRSGRHLAFSTSMFPIVEFKNLFENYKTAYVTNYLTGIVYSFNCYDSGFYTSMQYFVHRRLNTILVQEIKLSNPTDRGVDIGFQLSHTGGLYGSISRSVDIREGDSPVTYNVTSGYINHLSNENGVVVPFTIVHKAIPSSVKVEARNSKNFIFHSSIVYSLPAKKTNLPEKRILLEKTAIGEIQKVTGDPSHWKEIHANSWQQLWSTGFTIGTSKAKDVLNGDKINATMYYVLSQVKDDGDSIEVASHLSYAEGCYGNHHTLEAMNLWGKLDTVTDVNKVVSYWLLTLEKNGCHNVLRVGARGVVQAMVLSFGGLRFSNQHLEFNIDPKYLHRDHFFRRVAYGNRTHVNISVTVQEDNKAILRVALDRSDKNYYACDGGCLDPAVRLGANPLVFPVKLTEPLTPILYITYDKQHMEELKNAIHVHVIAEAPPHEHHVIALHKHGHHLGGLPTFFWVSVSTLILIFHLFLFKLIYNEYCSGGAFDRHRFRYGKL